jgi:predicted membrane protein
LIFLFVFRKKSRQNFFHYFLASVFSFSLLLSFFVVFPVTFERSITMYLLKTISQNQGINKKELEKKLIDEYILKNKALEKRLNEQKVINFIEIKNEKVYLTEKGKKFLKIANLIDKIFGINVFYE